MADTVAAADHRPGWLLDEIASAGRENLDVEHVQRYDAKEDADAVAEVARLRELGLHEGWEIVDLGAGTGQFAIAVAETVARVVAVDVSPVMTRRLEEKVVDAGATNIEVVRSGFLSYEHRGRAPDLVYSRYALHHLPDLWKAVALARIHDMLPPGGLFRLWDIIYDFEPAEAERHLEDWCASFTSEVEDGWSRAELEEHIRDEHSTFRWLLEPMLERCGFDIEDVRYSDDGFFGSYLARSR